MLLPIQFLNDSFKDKFVSMIKWEGLINNKHIKGLQMNVNGVL